MKRAARKPIPASWQDLRRKLAEVRGKVEELSRRMDEDPELPQPYHHMANGCSTAAFCWKDEAERIARRYVNRAPQAQRDRLALLIHWIGIAHDAALLAFTEAPR